MRERIVIKVGSSLLTDGSKFNTSGLDNVTRLISEASKKFDIILVSSGAVATGFQMLPLDREVVSNRQALASIGQPVLISKYQSIFNEYSLKCSQILVDHLTFLDEESSYNLDTTVTTLLNNGIIPIINANDSICTDELVFGDNDNLAAGICEIIGSDLLVILSDIDALYDIDPAIKEAIKVRAISDLSGFDLCNPDMAVGKFGTGGITTKLQAARYMMGCDKKMFLSSGMDISIASKFILDGVQVDGTLFDKNIETTIFEGNK